MVEKSPELAFNRRVCSNRQRNADVALMAIWKKKVQQTQMKAQIGLQAISLV